MTAPLRAWESPELTGWRRLPAHAVRRVPGEEVCLPSIRLRAEDRDLLTRANAQIEDGVIELDDAGLLMHPLLAAAPTLSLWRAPTDNDVLGGMAERWRKWGPDTLPAYRIPPAVHRWSWTLR